MQTKKSHALACLQTLHFGFAGHKSVITLTCLRLTPELAGDFGKELECEASACLPVTYATFAVARFAALNSIGSKEAVCRESTRFILKVLWIMEHGEGRVSVGDLI